MLSTLVVNDGLQPSLRDLTDWPSEFLRFERCELDVRLDDEGGDHLAGVTATSASAAGCAITHFA